MLGLGVGGGQLLVSYGTLLLLYAATASIGHSAKVRGEWEQYGLALLAMLLYNMAKAVLRSGAGAALGQALLCAASFWNAWVNRQQTNVRIPKPRRVTRPAQHVQTNRDVPDAVLWGLRAG